MVISLSFARSLVNSSFSLSKNLTSSRIHLNARIMSGKPNVVFVLGPPGSGKGTQCSKIVKTFGFVHLSAGDLLRAEQDKPNSKNGVLIKQYIKDGLIVPVEVTCSLIEEAMKESGKDRFLIDGFPRNQNNLEGWQTQMENKVNELFVLFLNCSEQNAIDRCLKRGQAGSGRTDDNMESLRKRFNTYQNDTMPIIDFYKKKEMVKTIDTDRDANTVFGDISKIFESLKN